MDSGLSINVSDVSKSFNLPHQKHGSIKNVFVNILNPKKGYEKQNVLKDISFDIKQGEFFGIVGRNGSGKSTLLKLLAGVYSPDNGRIDINGRLTPFIELGVGFNPELTGRENVFLNGALLGFSRKETEEMYQSIIEFAELENFVDQKLKNYSSGMQVRLAFSIAIRAQSEIILLDEVLAVGDESFQKKCLTVFDGYKKSDTTVVLVSHDMEMVRRYCDRALLIHDGELIMEGSPAKISERYSELNKESYDLFVGKQNTDERKELKINIHDNSGKAKTRFEYGDTINVLLKWPKNKSVENAGVSIYTGLGEKVYATNTFIDDFELKKGSNSITFKTELKLGEGQYYIMAGTFLDRPEKVIDFVSQGPGFNINKSKTINGEGIAVLEHSWHA